MAPCSVVSCVDRARIVDFILKRATFPPNNVIRGVDDTKSSPKAKAIQAAQQKLRLAKVG